MVRMVLRPPALHPEHHRHLKNEVYNRNDRDAERHSFVSALSLTHSIYGFDIYSIDDMTIAKIYRLFSCEKRNRSRDSRGVENKVRLSRPNFVRVCLRLPGVDCPRFLYQNILAVFRS